MFVKFEKLKMYSLWRGVQLAYGSPSNPSIQEHIGWWFCVVHRALNPHEPIHGSWHCWAIQARLDGHSWWIAHSGRQFGGVPNIPKAHEQTGRSCITWHSAFGPQAPDKQGFGCSSAVQMYLNSLAYEWIKSNGNLVNSINVFKKILKLLRTFQSTLFKWITNISSLASANRIMIDYSAFSAQTTSAFAWISTLLIYASGLLITFTTGHTFWSAIWRCTNKIWLTWARWPIANYATNAVTSTWARLARIWWWQSYNQKE